MATRAMATAVTSRNSSHSAQRPGGDLEVKSQRRTHARPALMALRPQSNGFQKAGLAEGIVLAAPVAARYAVCCAITDGC